MTGIVSFDPSSLFLIKNIKVSTNQKNALRSKTLLIHQKWLGMLPFVPFLEARLVAWSSTAGLVAVYPTPLGAASPSAFPSAQTVHH